MIAPQITIFVTKGDLPKKEYAFQETGQYLIGRSNDCAIRLPQERETIDVSRHHCVLDLNLDVAPPIVRIRDLGSRNGTYVNHAKIGQRRAMQAPEEADLSECAFCRLADGDEIQVGHMNFKVGIETDGEQPRPRRAGQAAEEKAPGLEVLSHVGPFWW